MNYYKKEWLSNYKENFFNYCALIEGTKKLKNNYINKKGNKESEKNLL